LLQLAFCRDILKALLGMYYGLAAQEGVARGREEELSKGPKGLVVGQASRNIWLQGGAAPKVSLMLGSLQQVLAVA
jgi:hypothetical protein